VNNVAIPDSEFYALRDAVMANRGKLSTHEKVCSERYKNISGAIHNVNTNVNTANANIEKIFGRFWKLAGVLILVLVGVVGTLYSANQGLQHDEIHTNNSSETTP